MTIASHMRKFRKTCRRFAANQQGNLTMMFGLAAIPVIAAAGMAVDYARISRVHDDMQIMADGATLAAAGAKNLSGTADQKKAARIQIATNYINNSLPKLTDAEVLGSPTVTATAKDVSVSVKARVRGSLINVLDAVQEDVALGQGDGGSESGITGRKFDIVVNSSATWLAGVNYVCLLALNATDSNTLEVKGTADIKAKNCSIWDNSASNSGLYQNGNATITAKQINVVGNYVGSGYTPMPNVHVSPFADPLAAKFATDYATAYGSAVVRNATKVGGKWKALDFAASGEFSIDPGKYMGGITVKNNRTVTLNPGVYFIEGGAFDVQAGGIVKAPNGVSIIVTDTNAGSGTVTNNSAAKFQVQGGGSFTIKAPSTGSFAGIAVAQHPNSRTDANKKEDYVIGGGTAQITGIMYFPKNKFYVTGAGDVSTLSNYFAIVADKIYIEGNGQLNVSQASDFDAAGLPALPAEGSGEAKVTLK